LWENNLATMATMRERWRAYGAVNSFRTPMLCTTKAAKFAYVREGGRSYEMCVKQKMKRRTGLGDTFGGGYEDRWL
jgi:hypothetical protein